MSNGINLATTPQQTASSEISPHLRSIRYLAIGVLFLVATASVIFFILLETSPLARVKQQESDALLQLARYHPDIAKLLILEERSTAINAIVTARPQISKMTQSLNNRLPSNITVQAFAVKQKTVTVTATSNSLTSIDQFINSALVGVQKKEYASVSLKSLSSDVQHGQFTITLEVTFL